MSGRNDEGFRRSTRAVRRKPDMIERDNSHREPDTMKPASVKKAAHQLIDQLPDDVSLDELAYRMAVRASIERGLADAEAGRMISQEDIEKEFGVRR